MLKFWILYKLITELSPIIIVAALRPFRFSMVANLMRCPRVTKKNLVNKKKVPR